jgi:peptidoglycan/LPS O-acetylase OafA/YrhL
LKGLAMILVVLYHAGGVLAWNNSLHGDLGVDIFVVVSGIGLAYGSRYEGAVAFLTRRLWRVFPTYWVALLLFWAGNVYLFHMSYAGFDLGIHVLGIQGWFGDVYGFAIDDSFWYVTMILTLYLTYCACHRLMDSPGWLFLAGSVISLSVALAYFYKGQGGMFSHLGLRLPGFFVGLLIGRLLKEGRLELKPAVPLVVGILILAYVPYVIGFIFANVVVGLALMAAYAFGWKRLVPSSIGGPTSRALTFFGTYSLEIFLLHQPLIRQYNLYVQARFLNDPAPSPGTVILGMAVALGVTLYASFELHRLIQRIPMPARRSTA